MAKILTNGRKQHCHVVSVLSDFKTRKNKVKRFVWFLLFFFVFFDSFFFVVVDFETRVTRRRSCSNERSLRCNQSDSFLRQNYRHTMVGAKKFLDDVNVNLKVRFFIIFF
jgi:hypothetical protein